MENNEGNYKVGSFLKGKNILDTDMQPLKVNRKRLEAAGTRFRGSVRLNLGSYYTPEEWEEKRKKVLNSKLP